MTLSAKQQSAHDRILRCPGCGAWEIVTRTEAEMRAAEIWPFTPPCPHDNRPESDARERGAA